LGVGVGFLGGFRGVAVVGMLVFLMMWGARADGYDAEPERN